MSKEDFLKLEHVLKKISHYKDLSIDKELLKAIYDTSKELNI